VCTFRNTAARLVLGLNRRARIIPAVRKQHWLGPTSLLSKYFQDFHSNALYEGCPKRLWPYL